VELVLGARAVALDRRARVVVTGDERRWSFDRLVVATGARARRLTGEADELVLRTIDDCLRLREGLHRAASLLIVGGGFLGMEVASTGANLGVAVTVVDRDPPLQRLLGQDLAAWVRARAQAAGVRFVQAGSGPSELVRVGQGWVYRSGDVQLHADVALSAVGDIPNTEWLHAAGLATTHGLRVDRTGRVQEGADSADGIYGVGDVTAHPAPDGTWQRTPFWSAALEQAQQVAHAVLDLPAPTAPGAGAGYYWSEQFGLDLRVCGTFPPSGRLRELDGSLAAGSAVLGWSSDEALACTVAAVNHRTPVARLKRWLDAESEPADPRDAAQLAQPAHP
jgi:NADPH-dependent 2,4-dienoyl-CoA reductase/sulfur reductase-like enzyme